eukprot:gnl/MRDRNA2_/MRDRNA2_98573_c0_seq1.p1 gnl/MRDRNA2_/MRDRNA2_98573_c0~~gnl/MRDRNA2_/MRDRNA2_98573_c0_seq1.p1  ORF type:complete len:247 (-),score=20.16 gnl/MRDRNA2_/MRDRNA2_98573_c0_seq1:21-761(-)
MVLPHVVPGETRAIPFLRRTASEAVISEKRKPWDRTTKMFENRGLTPNFRSYFDRPRDVAESGGCQPFPEEAYALGKNAIPKARRLVPHWSLRYVPEEELPKEKVHKDAAASSSHKRRRWNQNFGLMLENEGLHQNLRNYFDRRLDRPDPSLAGPSPRGITGPKPTWSLQDYTTTPVFCTDAPASESHRKKQAGWRSTTDLSQMNSYLHRNHREYFLKQPNLVWRKDVERQHDVAVPVLPPLRDYS